MTDDAILQLRAAVRDVPDFPKPGIVFKDITPILKDGALFRASTDLFLKQCRGKPIDKIVGIDARGFLFGSAVAYELGIGFVPLRKKGSNVSASVSSFVFTPFQSCSVGSDLRWDDRRFLDEP